LILGYSSNNLKQQGATMATTTRMTFEQFLQLPEDDMNYELNEGELLVTPSPTPYHNIARLRLAQALNLFVSDHRLGLVLDGTDFRLGPNTGRRPHVAFLSARRFSGLNLHQSPVEGAPTLAVEIISPTNSALDMMRKVHQYLNAAECQVVWVLYPLLNFAGRP